MVLLKRTLQPVTLSPWSGDKENFDHKSVNPVCVFLRLKRNLFTDCMAVRTRWREIKRYLSIFVGKDTKSVFPLCLVVVSSDHSFSVGESMIKLSPLCIMFGLL